MTKILLLAIDALRKDITYGDEVDTPNIDRLARNGQVFDRAFANGPATAAAFPAILCSSAENEIDRCPSGPTVAERFRDAGYETVGISTNPNTSPYFGYDRGFDMFTDFVKSGNEKEERSFLFKIARRIAHSSDRLYGFIRKNRAKLSLPYERAERLNEELFDHWTDGEDQFFFLHYMEPHYPYLPPADYIDTDSRAWRDRFELNERLKREDNIEPEQELTDGLWALYCGEVRYLDAALGEVVDRIEGTDEDVVVVFTADHGEMFGEFGGYLHPNELYNVNINVPFIVTGMDRLDTELVSHLDIGPTLLGAVGGDPAGFDGTDLAVEERDHVRVARRDKRCYIEGDWKLLEEDGDRALYDLSGDPWEQDDVSSEFPDIADELARKVQKTGDAVNEIDV